MAFNAIFQFFSNSCHFNSKFKIPSSKFYDHTIKLWNLKTGQLIRTLEGHSAQVLSVAISPDGQTLVSGSKDKTIKEWNLNTGQEIRSIQGHLADVNAIAISSHGQMFASASDDKTIKVWNLNTGQEIRTLKDIQPM